MAAGDWKSELMNSSEDITRAIEAFVRGFTFTRSFTHPYVGEQVGTMWVMRDAPRKGKSPKYRTEEWVAHGIVPQEIDQLVREQTRGRFTICTICANGESDQEMRAEFKELGYRLNATEPFMVHSLNEIPTFEQPAFLKRVTTHKMVERVNKAARSRQVLPEHVPSDGSLYTPIRQYVALIDDEIVGRVASIVAGEDTWVSNMYVTPEFRRRGIARALMSQMLLDDRAAGVRQSVLLASHTGAKLYPIVGYEEIGMLYIYSPPKI